MKISARKYYSIATRGGHVLEAGMPTAENGGLVTLQVNTWAEAQQWKLTETEEGFYKIVNRATKQVLDVALGGDEDGCWIHQWEFNDGDNQKWSVEDCEGGWVKIKSKLSGKSMDIVFMLDEPGMAVQIWEDVNGDNQMWTLLEKPVVRKAKKAEGEEKAEKPARKAPAKKAAAEAKAEKPAKKAPAKKAAKKAEKTEA